MKLINQDNEELLLPNDLWWSDEFEWSSVTAAHEYALDGTLIVEQAVKQAGRPITLKQPDSTMAWISRSTLQKLKQWADIQDARFTLKFEYEQDKRVFTVIFDNRSSPLSGSPVIGFPQHGSNDWFVSEIRLIEVKE